LVARNLLFAITRSVCPPLGPLVVVAIGVPYLRIRKSGSAALRPAMPREWEYLVGRLL
jgi:hypothetical protein